MLLVASCDRCHAGMPSRLHQRCNAHALHQPPTGRLVDLVRPARQRCHASTPRARRYAEAPRAVQHTERELGSAASVRLGLASERSAAQCTLGDSVRLLRSHARSVRSGQFSSVGFAHPSFATAAACSNSTECDPVVLGRVVSGLPNGTVVEYCALQYYTRHTCLFVAATSSSRSFAFVAMPSS
jgi:hypothetical protein